ncbi:hypothetical protein Q1695_011411 [Nippostrongylus brasiliensis]|nr:hypothetical protein Q1695_011411 [Nippostrongylus brasiliensis]
MILPRIGFFAAALSLCVSDDTVLVDGHQPYRVPRALRGQTIRGNPNGKYPRLRDSAQDVIYAPLDGVITKGIFYVNAKSTKDDQMYGSMLRNGVESVEGIDPFFVTRPPMRTTMATKVGTDDQRSIPSDDIDLQQLQDVGKFKMRNRAPLRLVTIAPTSTTPLPPFKHRRPVARSKKEDIVSTSAYVSNDKLLKPQAWPIPTIPPLLPPGVINPMQNLLAPLQSQPLPPPMPFQPLQLPKELNISYPFIPIGTDQRPTHHYASYESAPASLAPQSRHGAVHRSSLRKGSFVHNVNVAPIPLPITPGFTGGDAYVDSTRVEFAKKPTPEVDFSIDNGATMNKPDSRPPAVAFPGIRQIRPRSITGPYRDNREETPLKTLGHFANHYPNALERGQLPAKESTLVWPKSYGAEGQMPTSSVARSRMSPNEKLDLCCRKRAVNPSCQSMCNFDVLNDKTLVSAFLTNVCPGQQLAHAVECASSKVDHSSCCEGMGISSFFGGRCMPFCRANAAQPTNPFEFLPCLQVFEYIKTCYRRYQVNNPNILGD